ncbi:MAG: DEAD/DEAH box helicase, partial [Deltaproteobacteria bacterium]|nr:DEAD/DEAH box helicase [Deltaproteobacteria bacterium]
LVLTPSSLVNQWQEELREKFGLDFVSSNDAMFRQDHEKFWAEPFIVASISSARMARHCDAVTSRFFDLVIVDEAHHLRNPKSKTWQLVNAIQKTFFLLLTATPVQNKLEELYSLVTILRPGHLKTRKAFLEEFVTRGKPTDPRNRSKLKELLKEIMVRNTRSVTQLRLPPRFAFTTRVGSGELERAFYDGISSLVSDGARKAVSGVSIMTLRKLLEAAGSSHHAALSMLEKLRTDQDPDTKSRVEELISLGKKIGTSSKTARVLELLRSLPERKIVFVNYLATLHHLREVLDREGIAHSAVYGGLTPAQKHAAIEDFKSRVPVLIGTGIGGEGHNLQFCNIMINYDLPWNPMEIE